MIRRLDVTGRPASQGSKRVINGRIIEQMDDKVKAWRAAVGVAALQDGGRTFTGPVMVDVDFFWTRPKVHYRANGLLHDAAPQWKSTVPDIDKVIRCTLDGLVEHRVLEDDSLVVGLVANKRWTAGESGARIIVRTAE